MADQERPSKLFKFYDEDEVSLLDCQDGGSRRYGLVVQSSEYVSSDEEDPDSGDDPIFTRVKNGTVRVAWYPEGQQDVVSEDKLKLEDRSLMPGDVIKRRLSDKESQKGFVVNSKVQCDVRVIGSDYVIRNVDSKRLEMMEPWTLDPGDVYLDSWVGRIVDVFQTIHMRLPDGTVFYVDDEDDDIADLFEDIHDKRPVESEFFKSSFYKGQFVKITLRDIFKEIKKAHPKSLWIKKRGNTEVICVVEKVEVKSVYVQWLCRGYGKANNDEEWNTHPPRTLKQPQISRLRTLDCFKPCSVQIGDRAVYKVQEEDKILEVQQEDTSKKNPADRDSTNAEDDTKMDVDQNNKINGVVSDTSRADVAESTADQDSEPSAMEVNCDAEVVQKDLQNNKTSSEKEVKAPKSPGNSQEVVQSSRTKLSKSKDSGIKLVSKKLASKDRMIIDDQAVEDVSSDSSEDYEDYEDEMEEEETEEAEVKPISSEDVPSEPKKNETDKAEASKLSVASSNVRPQRIMRCRPGDNMAPSRHRKAPRQLEAPPLEIMRPVPGDSVNVEIVYTVSSIDVIWQDSSCEKNIASSDLDPVHHLDELELFPGDYVTCSEKEDPNVYGVVTCVNHTERTCVVRWVTPYKVGEGNRPDETIETEEVSVYDVKDHPSYKFRPGHIVLRVGGYNEENGDSTLSAAGQVFALGTDGRILIQWADGTQSHCYPQEILLIETELSELNDSWDDSDDSDFGSENSDNSWETEDEEEDAEGGGEDGDTQNKQDKGKSKLPNVEANQKPFLDQKVHMILHAVQEQESNVLSLLELNPESTTYLLETIIQTHQHCRHLDKTLKSSYFKDTKMTAMMQVINDLMERDVQDRISRQARDLFLVNTKGSAQESAPSVSSQATQVTNEAGGDQPMRVSEMSENSSSNVGTDGDSNSTSGSGKAQNERESKLQDGGDGQEAAAASPKVGDNSVDDSSGSHPSTDTAVTEKSDVDPEARIKQALLELISLQTSSECSLSAEEELKQLAEMQEFLDQNAGSLTDDSELSVETLTQFVSLFKGSMKTQLAMPQKGMPDKLRPAIVFLLKSSFRQLITVLRNIQRDLNLRWEELKAEGKLKVLEDEEDEDEEEIAAGTPPDAPVEDATVTEQATDPADGEKAKLHLDLDTSTPLNASFDPGATPLTPQTPADVLAKLDVNWDGFSTDDEAPESHRFFMSSHEPSNPKAFFSAIKKELKMLKSGLPKNIFVKGFENRMDLYSIMMLGPSCTPYEDGLFFFDIQLPNDYPSSPPRVHYLSFCCERLNPNLYEDGKVCVSLLGTWTGKGTEVWTNKSSILQVLISIQGLILVSEPYYNEAGYEKQKGSQLGTENSRMYNEMAVLKMVESMTRMTKNPPRVFEAETRDHIRNHAQRMITRLMSWLSEASQPCEASGGTGDTFVAMDDRSAEGAVSKERQDQPTSSKTSHSPGFPLFPLSRGMQITLKKHIGLFESALSSSLDLAVS